MRGPRPSTPASRSSSAPPCGSAVRGAGPCSPTARRRRVGWPACGSGRRCSATRRSPQSSIAGHRRGRRADIRVPLPARLRRSSPSPRDPAAGLERTGRLDRDPPGGDGRRRRSSWPGAGRSGSARPGRGPSPSRAEAGPLADRGVRRPLRMVLSGRGRRAGDPARPCSCAIAGWACWPSSATGGPRDTSGWRPPPVWRRAPPRMASG